MWASVAIMGLAAIISHSLLRRYLTSIKSQTHEPQSQDKNQNQNQNQNKAGCTEQEEMMINSDGIHILESLSCGGMVYEEAQSSMFNSNPFDASQWSISILSDVMEALTDPNTHLIGAYGSGDEIKDAMLQKVCRRVQRDQLYGMVVTATVTKRPDVSKIQEDIARQLGFTFNQKSKAKRAKELIDRIKNEQNILIVLCDVHKGLDLSMVGIPYGADHNGCKILLTSTNEDVLSNHMHTQKNIEVK